MAKSNNNTLLWIGAAAAALVIISKDTIKNTIVEILKSIKRTFVNEGTWEPENEHQAKDIGNYYPQQGANRVYYGTNYGVTAGYLVEHFNVLRIPLNGKDTIKNLTKDQAREIFSRVVGGRMRYAEMTNQFVADFIFDWMVQRPNTCVSYMTEKIFGFSNAEKLDEINSAKFSDKLVNKINSSDPAGLYNALKFWRLYHLTYTETYRSFRQGVYNRIVKYDDFPRTPEVQNMINIAYNKAFGKQIKVAPLKQPAII